MLHRVARKCEEAVISLAKQTEQNTKVAYTNYCWIYPDLSEHLCVCVCVWGGGGRARAYR
jgi:hypothetical protein